MASTKPSPRLLSLLNGKATPSKSMLDEEEILNFPMNPNLKVLPSYLDGQVTKNKDFSIRSSLRRDSAFKSPSRDSLSSRQGKRSVDNFIRQVVDKTLVFKSYENDFDNYVSNNGFPRKNFDFTAKNVKTEKKSIKKNVQLKRELPSFYTPQKFVKGSFKNKINTENYLHKHNNLLKNQIENSNEKVTRNLFAEFNCTPKKLAYNKYDHQIINDKKNCDLQKIEEKYTNNLHSIHENPKIISLDDKNSWYSSRAQPVENHLPNQKEVKIHSFCTKTSKGLVRNYNEDKVAIIMDMNPGQSEKPGLSVNSFIESDNCPKEIFSTSSVQSMEKSTPANQSQKNNNPSLKNSYCSYFGLYDGHSGNSCADYLRDNLHHYVLENNYFVSDKEKALYEAINLAEKKFTKKSYDKQQNLLSDESGSCLLSILIDINTNLQNKMQYVANVGDSRAIMSLHKGQYIKELTNDHKPSCVNEKQRIYSSGGKTFKSETLVSKIGLNEFGKEFKYEKIKYGVERIFPGGLSLSRAIGDISAKVESLGGNSNCQISTPEMKKVILQGDEDFLVMGCDGIWDVLDNEQVISCVFEALSQKASEMKRCQYNHEDQNRTKTPKKKSIKDLFTPTKTIEISEKDSDSSESFTNECPINCNKLFYNEIIENGVCLSFNQSEKKSKTGLMSCSKKSLIDMPSVSNIRNAIMSSKQPELPLSFDAEIVSDPKYKRDLERKLDKENIKVCDLTINARDFQEEATSFAVSSVINLAQTKKSGDNITAIIVLFKPLEYFQK